MHCALLCIQTIIPKMKQSELRISHRTGTDADRIGIGGIKIAVLVIAQIGAAEVKNAVCFSSNFNGDRSTDMPAADHLREQDGAQLAVIRVVFLAYTRLRKITRPVTLVGAIQRWCEFETDFIIVRRLDLRSCYYQRRCKTCGHE